MRLHFRAPSSQQAPENPESQPGDALGTQRGRHAHHGHQSQGNQDHAGTQPEKFSRDDSQREQQGGMEERSATRGIKNLPRGPTDFTPHISVRLT